MTSAGDEVNVADGLVLAVRNLTTVFETRYGVIRAVDDVSFTVRPREIIGIVGESGSGKTTLGRSLLSLVPPPGRIIEGQIVLNGKDIRTLRDEDMRRLRGDSIAMIFQNPMRALHPAFSIGWQLREALRTHHSAMAADEMTRTIVEMLARVGVPDAERRLRDYPHQFSGGMQQRVMIAMSLMNSPAVLVADEPTTALDVTVQAQILTLLRSLVAEQGMSVVLITHNLGVVASICDRVVVMYAGQTVEEGTVDEIFDVPLHPYTRDLLDSLPERQSESRLRTIPGGPPQLDSSLDGCRFRERCALAEDICAQSPLLLEATSGHLGRCWVSQREGKLPMVAAGGGKPQP